MLSGGTSPEPCLMTPPLQHGGQSGGSRWGRGVPRFRLVLQAQACASPAGVWRPPSSTATSMTCRFVSDRKRMGVAFRPEVA